jgi:hypothetical protein
VPFFYFGKIFRPKLFYIIDSCSVECEPISGVEPTSGEDILEYDEFGFKIEVEDGPEQCSRCPVDDF